MLTRHECKPQMLIDWIDVLREVPDDRFNMEHWFVDNNGVALYYWQWKRFDKKLGVACAAGHFMAHDKSKIYGLYYLMRGWEANSISSKISSKFSRTGVVDCETRYYFSDIIGSAVFYDKTDLCDVTKVDVIRELGRFYRRVMMEEKKDDD